MSSVKSQYKVVYNEIFHCLDTLEDLTMHPNRIVSYKLSETRNGTDARSGAECGVEWSVTRR